MKKTGLLYTMMLVLLFPAVATAQAQVLDTFGFRCHPYLQNLTEHSISILWLMNRDCTSWVEYGPTTGMESKAHHSENGLIDAGGNLQKVTLQNLEPGRKYYYRTASREIKQQKPYQVVYGDTVYSPVHSFTTPSAGKEDCSFLVFNDTHNKPEYINEILKKETNFDFIVFNGDIIADIVSEDQIVNNFMDFCAQSFAAEKPFIYVRGNHETRGPFARKLKPFMENGSDGFYYTYQYGKIFFIILDTGEDKVDGHKEYFGLADFYPYRTEEAAWLGKVVGNKDFKKSKYRIVFAHIPVKINQKEDKEGGALDCSQKFAPILNQQPIDLMISGHLHQSSLTPPQKNGDRYPIVIGGSPVTGKKVAYIKVNVRKDKQEALLKNMDGSVIGSYTFEK